MNRRQIEILDTVSKDGEVLVAALAAQYGVAEMTIRRDLDELARQGKVMRTHGGAMPSRQSVVEFSFSEKGRVRMEEKQAIGRYIAESLEESSTVVLDTGTTTLEVARALAGSRKRLTVLTTSLAIASILHSCEQMEVVLLGGTMRKNSPDLTGFLAEENLKRFRVDVAILGADAVSRDGVFTTDMGVARCSRAMIESAKTRILAVDSSKFEARALFRFASWKDLQYVVTGRDAGSKTRRWLKASASQVTYVER